MNTRILMGVSALFMATLGVVASFFPQEILTHTGSHPERLAVLVVQINGALYMGFAILNWTARANLIGGIYSRPVALGNFFHFAVVGAVLSKALMAGQNVAEMMAGAAVYSAFAISFGWVLFTHPRMIASSEPE